MADPPWYESFFGQRYLDYYGPKLTPERTTAEVDFIERILALPAGACVLDLCCGHGRHLIELASRGYRMTGVDLDSTFLEMAHAEAKRRRLAVRLERRDMRDLPFVAEFDGAINWFTAFGYFDQDEENQAVLVAVARTLKPGGKFLIDLTSRDWLVREFKVRDWHETPTGIKVLEERNFDLLKGRNYARHIRLYPDGTRLEGSFSLRVYTLTELTAMVRQAGLDILATFGGVDGSPHALDSRQLIILAVKPG